MMKQLLIGNPDMQIYFQYATLLRQKKEERDHIQIFLVVLKLSSIFIHTHMEDHEKSTWLFLKMPLFSYSFTTQRRYPCFPYTRGRVDEKGCEIEIEKGE